MPASIMERKSPSAALEHGFRKPPQAPATSKSIIADAKKLVERWCRAEDDIVQTVLPDTATFANVLLPLAQLENATALQVNILGFYQDVSTDAEMRDASREAQELLDTAKNGTAIREDLFHLVDAVLKREGDLDPESQLYLEREHRRFIERGVKLATGLQKSRFERIQNRLNQLRGQFRKNLSDENDGIWFALEELDGVPDDLISKLDKGENEHRGKLMLKLADQEHHSVLSFAQEGDTRQRFYIARENRTSQNRPLLKECLVLRDEAARILGYPNHAAYRLENMMAKDPETVNTFLDDLQSGLLAAGQQALGRLKQLKKVDVESQGGVYDGRFFLWDQDFYHRKMLTTHFSVDKLKIAEYFPIQTTVMGILRIFERLFGLVFAELPSEERTADMLWHEDVRLFSVWNEVELGGGFVGYLYLDLLHRDGKYGSAFNCTVQPGFAHEDGRRCYPATALVCNFSKSSHEKPSLLKHFDIVLLSHELGHGIHDLVAKTRYARFHGTNLVVDFGEAPSQMLENCCWIPSVLKSLSKHYSHLSPEFLELWKKQAGVDAAQPAEQIPDEMVQDLLQTRHITFGPLFYLSQLHFAMFDMRVHQPASHEAIKGLDLSVEWNSLRKNLRLMDGAEVLGHNDDWDHGYAHFGHLVGSDYDSAFYSYLFSQVYSADMFHKFFESDPMNGREGRRYRRVLLERGGGQDEMKTLADYLGREPNSEAFRRSIGLS